MTTMTLDRVAKLLKIHPRTVLRAMEGDKNAYWADGHNPVLNIENVAATFDFDPIYLTRADKRRDDFLTPREAAQIVGVPERTFRYRRYEPVIRRTHTVRYSRMKVVNEHLTRFEAIF